MTASSPFVDRETNGLNITQIVAEAVPIAGLLLLFVTVAAIPFGLSIYVAPPNLVGDALTLLAQFILVTGAAIVLLYLVARGNQLA